jgi:hypothetical protein
MSLYRLCQAAEKSSISSKHAAVIDGGAVAFNKISGVHIVHAEMAAIDALLLSHSITPAAKKQYCLLWGFKANVL